MKTTKRLVRRDGISQRYHVGKTKTRHVAPKRWFVTMTDKFMSGWGRAEGKTNKYVVECDTYQQAETIERNAKERNEMKYINITSKKPYYNSRQFMVSWKKYSDLGDIWKK